MSGPICPTCGCPSWSGPLNATTCEYCGWKGDVTRRPYKRLTQDGYREWDERIRAKVEGRVLTIEFDPASDASSEIMKVLGTDSLTHDHGVARIEMKEKPDVELLKRLRSVPGVREVT